MARQIAGLAVALAAALLSVAPARADVADGGFERPAVSGTVNYVAPATVDAWTLTAGRLMQADASGWTPASGVQSIEFGAPDIAAPSDAIRQVVSVVPGRHYRLSFRYADGVFLGAGYLPCGAIAGIVEPVTASWNGVPVLTVPWSGGHLTDDWQSASTVVAATGDSAVLELGDHRENDFERCGMTLDDVALGTASAQDTGITLASSPNPSVTGQPVTVTATVIGGDAATVPLGSVQFAVDGVPTGAPVPLDAGGHATLVRSTLAPGTHAIGAAFQPAAASGFQPAAASALTQTVQPAATTTTMAATPDRVVAGQPGTISVRVAPVAPGAGTPTGSVALRLADGTPIAGPVALAGGAADIVLAGDAGTYDIVADYSGDAGFTASSGALTVTVAPADTVASVTSDHNPVAPGGDVTFTVRVRTVAPGAVPPLGPVAILIDGHTAADDIPLFPDDFSSSSVDVTFRAPERPGEDTIGAAYEGDDDTNPSTAQTFVQRVVAPLTPAAPVPPAPSPTPPPPVAPRPATSLQGFSRPLLNALHRRGLAALGRVTETLTAAGPAVLQQQVFTPRAPHSALAARSRPRLLAAGRHTFAAAGRGTLKLRLTSAGRRAVKRGRRMALEIVTRFTPVGGTAVVRVDRVSTRGRAARMAARPRPHGSWSRLAR